MLRPRRSSTDPLSAATRPCSAFSAASAPRYSASSVFVRPDEACEASRAICRSSSLIRERRLSMSGWSGFISVRFS